MGAAVAFNGVVGQTLNDSIGIAIRFALHVHTVTTSITKLSRISIAALFQARKFDGNSHLQERMGG